MNWEAEGETMTIGTQWRDQNWNRVIGEAISLRGLKTLIPGMWVSDEIINISIKRFMDEAQSDEYIHVMDTQFYNLISWNDKMKKIRNYPKRVNNDSRK